jgi:predicted permease
MPPDRVRQSGSVLVDDADPAATRPVVEQTRADAGYFAALGVPVLAGRAFTDADRQGAPLVAVVNETFARRLLGVRGDPSGAVGRRLAIWGDSSWMTVVGVARDVRYAGLASPVEPAVYYHFAQDPFAGMFLFVRTGGDPLRLTAAVQRAVLAIDPELPVTQVRTLDARVTESIAAPRFQTTLLALFGALALALAVVGVYGVVAYGVAQRRREMGVRLALGARQSDVLRLVVAGALRPVWLGVALGLAGAAAGARVLGRFAYGTSVREPVTYAAVALLLVAVAAVASWVPARRAARADPVAALRAD